jgi:hypothetical protein
MITTGSLLAAGSGYGASVAFSGSKAVPSTTVTISVGSGATGPQGPTGPSGPAGPQGEPGTGGGADTCPAGSTFGEVKFVVQGQGPTSILTCVKD